MATRTGEPMSPYQKNEEQQTSAIRSDIARTRGNMSRTVDEIEERLSPAHIKEQVSEIKQSMLVEYHDAKDHLKADISRELREAKDKLQGEIEQTKAKVQEEIHEARAALREATVGKVEHMVHDARDTVTDAGSSVIETIKSNPVPAALVAVGLGWLFMSGRSSTSRRMTGGRSHAYGYETTQGPQRLLREGQRYIGNAAHSASEGLASLGHRVEAGASQLVNEAAGAAQGIGNRVSHFAHDAAAGVEGFAGDAQAQGRRLAQDAGRQVRRAEQTFESTLRDNPLAVGAVALAVGAAIGLALPNTETEDEWMGAAKDRLFDRAEGVAADALHSLEDKVAGQLGSGGPDTQRNGGGERSPNSKPSSRSQVV